MPRCELDRDPCSCWDSGSALLSCMIQWWSHFMFHLFFRHYITVIFSSLHSSQQETLRQWRNSHGCVEFHCPWLSNLVLTDFLGYINWADVNSGLHILRIMGLTLTMMIIWLNPLIVCVVVDAVGTVSDQRVSSHHKILIEFADSFTWDWVIIVSASHLHVFVMFQRPRR